MTASLRGGSLAGVALAVAHLAAGQQEPLRVQAVVESQRVFVGQHFLFQIQVHGSDQPGPVDLRALERDFTVSETGGGPSNSTSVSIVNGRMTQQVRRGYNLNYRLAAKAVGDKVIPALAISAEGRSQSTQPIPMRVLPPQENSDFRFRLSLSEDRAYVGQQIALTAEWFIGRQVQDFSFTFPLLEDGRFEIADPPDAAGGRSQASTDRMEIALGDRRAVAFEGTGELDGRKFTVLRFRKLLVPRSAGTVRVPAATVTFRARVASRTRRPGPFDDFFGGDLLSDFFGDARDVETLSIPSNRPRIEVLELPAAGRPRGFNGWIGQFEVVAEASPVSVKVGDPITLRVGVSGNGMRAAASLPALDQQPALTRDFNVPREIGAGEDRNGERVFTQTLRARYDSVTEIPAIELPFFDPEDGEYRVARTEPIPIRVEPSRVVTADDAEGRGIQGQRQLEVESSEQGIAHNYVGRSALQSAPGALAVRLRPLGPLPLALALLGLPPLAYIGLHAARMARRHGGSALRWRQSPRTKWRREVSAIDLERGPGGAVAEAVLASLRAYLGARLARTRSEAAAWSFADAEVRLRSQASLPGGSDGIEGSALLADLKSVFERCETASYAGVEPMDRQWRRRLVADAVSVVDRIEEAAG